MIRPRELTKIWKRFGPLQKEKDRIYLKIICQHKLRDLLKR